MRDSPISTVFGLIAALVAVSLGIVGLFNGFRFWIEAREGAQWQTCRTTTAVITSYQRGGETTVYDRTTRINIPASRFQVEYSYRVGDLPFTGKYTTTGSTVRQLKDNYGMKADDVEKENQKQIGKTFTLYYLESNPKDGRLERPGTEPGKYVLSYFLFGGGGLIALPGIIGMLVILKEMREEMHLQSVSAVGPEASRPTQLVGENCAVCKNRISSILGAGFCPSCYQGVHDSCRRPQGLTDRCSTCGGSK